MPDTFTPESDKFKKGSDIDHSRRLLQAHMDSCMAFLSQTVDTHGLCVDTLSKIMESFSRQMVSLPQDNACKKGCAYCCHLRVGVSISEAVLIFMGIEQHTAPEIKKHLKKTILQTAEKGAVLEGAWWRETQTPCPLLEVETGCCTVYSLRPFSCRAHHSTDASVCREGFDNACKVNVPCYPLYRAFTDLHATIFIKGMAQLGLKSYQVGLTAALGILYRSSTPEQLIERWFQGQDIFSQARLI